MRTLWQSIFLHTFFETFFLQTYENIVAVDYTFDEEGFENSSDLAKDFIQKLFHKEPRSSEHDHFDDVNGDGNADDGNDNFQFLNC